jgi:antiviral helicase SKI2
MEDIKEQLDDQRILLVQDFENRIKVLTELQYLDEHRTVQLKGRVACEINTCESLILTEFLMDNVIHELTCEETVAVLSTLVFQKRVDQEIKLPGPLILAKDKLIKITENLAKLQIKHRVADIEVMDYVKDNVNVGLMQVCYEWAKGTEFAKICELTDVLEGTIVRCINRLAETCKAVRNAARVIGDAALYQKMEKCGALIKRDIVFAASLYVK